MTAQPRLRDAAQPRARRTTACVTASCGPADRGPRVSEGPDAEGPAYGEAGPFRARRPDPLLHRVVPVAKLLPAYRPRTAPATSSPG